MVPINTIHLCTGCGACYAICSFNAINMQLSAEGTYRPVIDASKCKQCGLCEKVCPSLQINHKISLDCLGKFIHCYTGYSTDKSIRWNASSGGVTTTILDSLFEEGAISGAVVLKNNPENPLTPLMAFVNSRKEILDAMGSRYCPVRPHFFVSDLIRASGKIAVVGLPCHILAFRRLEEINSALKEKVLIIIGLLCGRCPNIYATKYFLKRAKIQEKSVSKLHYRGRGWPGTFLVETVQGSRFFFRLGDWYNFSYYPQFISIRCALCVDLTNQQADLTLGDAWGLADDKIGSSILITRTLASEQILQRFKSRGKLVIAEVPAKKIFQEQGFGGKIRVSLIRAYLWKKVFRQPIPFESVIPDKISIKEWSLNMGYCTMLSLSRVSVLRHLLCNLTPITQKINQSLGKIDG